MQRHLKENYHHGDLRNALIEAAIVLLAQHGVDGLSLREVAKAAGVSHAAPYRHFRNKTELLESIAALGYNRLEEACQLAAKKFPDDPERQFFEAGMGYLTLVMDQPEIAYLMFSGILSGQKRSEALSSAGTKAVQSLAQIIENGKQLGIYADQNTEDLTLTALACVHGISMMILGGLIKRPATKQQLRALGKRVSSMLLAGLLRR